MRVPTIPPLKEAEGVFGLLAFLADKSACEARLNQLEALRNEINNLVEAHGKADEIHSLHAQAEEAVRDAGRVLEQAKAKAQEIKDSARADVEAEKSNLTIAREEAKAEAERTRAMRGDLSSRVAAVAAAEDALRAREQAANDRMAEAQKISAAADKAKAEYEERRRNLLAAVQ